MKDEYLDLVDEHDHVIGKRLRSEIYRDRQLNFRAVHLFIKNSRGKLWVPRRTADKRIFPLALDFSAAGHVESGESYKESLIRETQEELNLDLRDFELRYVGKTTPRDGTCFIEHYEISSDEVPHYNPTDFIEYFWLTPEALLARIDAGDYAKDSIPIALKHFYLS